MCGIIGICSKNNVITTLVKGLHNLEYRGYDSAGISIICGKSMMCTIKAVGKVDSLEKKIYSKTFKIDGNIGIAHTRWATHGEPSEINAHPHNEGTISVVHNGIIENYEELKEKLITEGYIFKSSTDTEVIVKLIAKYKKNSCNLRQAVTLAIKELKGSCAIAVIDSKEPDIIIGACEGSPLVVGLGVNQNFLASDVVAFGNLANQCIYLSDGDICEVSQNEVKFFDNQGWQINRNALNLNADSVNVDKGSFSSFMLKEIYEQPKALLNTFIFNQTLRIDPSLFKNIENIHIVACGTSYHAGLIAKYYFEKLAKVSTSVEIASEYRYRDVVVPKNTLFITISQSGETADTIAALKKALNLGYVKTIAICNVNNSTLVRNSDFSLLTKAGTEIGVASTKAFTTQLLSLLYFTLELGLAKEKIDKSFRNKIFQDIEQLPKDIEKVLSNESYLSKLSEDFIDKDKALYLGRGTMFPIALEGALKLKEISYIFAEGYAAGELKHGPIALVDRSLPIVILAPDDQLLPKLLSNIEEVKSRGGILYIFTSSNTKIITNEQIKVIPIDYENEFLTPIVYTVALQLLAYHVAIKKGKDVDKPRNLAKSVTVE